MLTDNDAASFVAANLRRLLESRGLSMRGLARLTGDTPMRISDIASGRHVPSIGVVHRIAEALDVTIDALVRPVAEKKNSA